MFYFSYSSLKKLLYSPRMFYNEYILNQREETFESYLVEGRVIHTLLFQPEKYTDMFITSYGGGISDSVKGIIDKVFTEYKKDMLKSDLDDYHKVILQEMKTANFYQSLKADSQRLDKIINSDTKIYWSFLKTSEGKYIIDKDTFNRCGNLVNKIRTNKKACSLMGIDIPGLTHGSVVHEKFLQTKLYSEFGIKGYLDSCLDNTDEVIIADLKTTSKSLFDFKETVEFYMYWLQAAIYYRLVSNTTTKPIKFYFVVVDRSDNIYSFRVSDKTMTEWLSRLDQSLIKARWHFAKNDFDLPYLFATNQYYL